MREYFSEALVLAHRQQLEISETIHKESSETQEVVIFRNPLFGAVMALDGVVQTTTGDEFVYHEMLTHVPILAHGSVRRALIIGGGDGGILRHVLKHPNIQHITLVEIEPRVIDLTKKYMPEICGDAFDNARAHVIIGDGCAFVHETNERFDVIMVDSTDPHGPGEVLFTPAFYADCKRCLTAGGIMVTQSGVPFSQPQIIQNSKQALSRSFTDVGFYMATVPTYISGPMAFGFATDNSNLKRVDINTLTVRQRAAAISDCRYYTPTIHCAAFALPRYVEKLLGNSSTNYEA